MMPPESKRRPGQGAAEQGLAYPKTSSCTALAVQAQPPIADLAHDDRLKLRPYQHDVIHRLRVAARQHQRVLLVAPTGSGKTVIASAIVYGAVAKGKRVLVLAHRRELIDQAVSKLWACGIDAGIILAGRTPRSEQPVQVASVQTLWARAFRGTSMEAPLADVIVVDEAHHVRAQTYGKILDHYPNAFILGLTATPCRGDGRGLGNVFGTLVECPGVQELIALSFLVATKVYAPSTPDLSGIRVERGDYVESQLAERVNTDRLVGDIVDHWHRLAEGRKTVIFATGVPHSLHIRDEFRQSGVWAEHIDGSTPIEEREAILKGLSECTVKVVTNCMVLTEGWDQPDVACIVLARPTKSMGLYRQMIGRVLRPADRKDHALVLDHSGAVFDHGFVEDPVAWTLDQDKRATNAAQSGTNGSKPRELTACPECSAVRIQGQPCPACGWRPRPKKEAVETVDGELARLERDGSQHGVTYDPNTFYRQLLGYAKERGYDPGWAAHKHREKFGFWPQSPRATLQPPSDAVRAWIRSRQIAFAKARAKKRSAS